MKKLLVVLIVAAAAAGLYWFKASQDSGPELKVESYFRKLDMPEFTPMSGGYPSGSPQNPVYLNMRNIRHFVIIVSVPARRLLAVDQTEADGEITDDNNTYLTSDGRKYPKFVMITKEGVRLKPRGVFAWPRRGPCTKPDEFTEPQTWYPAPDEKPNKRFRLALYWRIVQVQFETPFQLQMDDLPAVEVTDDQDDFFHHWEE
ncbi:MAG: hypothetical protein JW810_12745 [Sedimentisphaerales bacterium]|nr:hypothetical protein [Sedimentisphaerales bacterium]